MVLFNGSRYLVGPIKGECVVRVHEGAPLFNLSAKLLGASVSVRDSISADQAYDQLRSLVAEYYITNKLLGISDCPVTKFSDEKTSPSRN